MEKTISKATTLIEALVGYPITAVLINIAGMSIDFGELIQDKKSNFQDGKYTIFACCFIAMKQGDDIICREDYFDIPDELAMTMERLLLNEIVASVKYSPEGNTLELITNHSRLFFRPIEEGHWTLFYLDEKLDKRSLHFAENSILENV